MGVKNKMIIVKINHLRAANLCASGGRAWFAKYNLSWQTFLDEGYPVETIEATQDAFGLQVAAIAREEAEDGRR